MTQHKIRQHFDVSDKSFVLCVHPEDPEVKASSARVSPLGLTTAQKAHFLPFNWPFHQVKYILTYKSFTFQSMTF